MCVCVCMYVPPVLVVWQRMKSQAGSFASFFSQNGIWCSSARIQYVMSFVFASVILDTGSILPDSYSVMVAMEIVTS